MTKATDDEMQIASIALHVSKSYDDCVDLCEKLGLIERMAHGDKEYIRYTEDGMHVLATLLTLQTQMDRDSPLVAS